VVLWLYSIWRRVQIMKLVITPLPVSLLGPHIHLSTLFPNILGSFPSLKVTGLVLHPHKALTIRADVL
jgi:hypothetical protein